jgi:hypothetical protein
MKLCRAWPEYCAKSSNSEVSEDQVYPKALVESQVLESLQKKIDTLVKEVVDEPENEPEELATKSGHPIQIKSKLSNVSKTDKLSKTIKTSKDTLKVSKDSQTLTIQSGRDPKDVWIFLGAFVIIFIFLLSSLYNRIAVLERVIFDMRV